MNKIELNIILFFPVLLLVISLMIIYDTYKFDSFSNEINSGLNQSSKLIMDFKKVDVTDKKKLRELVLLNQRTLNIAQEAFKYYSIFSTETSKRIKKHFYIIIFITILNIYFVISIYRRHKNAK